MMSTAEKSIMDYVREHGGKIAKLRQDVDVRYKLGSHNNPKMVLFSNRDWLSKYDPKGRDKHMLYRKLIANKIIDYKKNRPLYMDDELMEFRSINAIESDIDKELSSEMNTWVKDSNKLAPRLIQEESKYRYDIETALSKWVALKRKDKIREDFKKISAENIRKYRNDQIQLMRDYYGRELYKWEIDLIEGKVNKVKNITRLINDYVFRFDMPDRIMNQIRVAVTDRIFYEASLGVDDPDSSAFKKNFYEGLGEIMKRSAVVGDFTHQKVLNLLKSFWIMNVLLLRPSWYLWNNLGDSVRAMFGVRDAKILKDMQLGYMNASQKYISKLKNELTADIRLAYREARARKILKRYDPKIDDIKTMKPQELTALADKLNIPADVKALLSKEIKEIQGLRTYRVFDVLKEPKLGWGLSKRADEILNFRFDPTGKAITRAGEEITQRDLEWITSSGLVQAITNPVYARRLIESMPDKTWWDRILKRSRVLKGDLQMYASATEQIRRQTMAFDLLFNKAYSLAQTEKTVKRWLFDYRDITHAGRMMRVLFPFYTFSVKSLQLYFSLLAKMGPGVVRAGHALVEAMEEESAALPEYMKDRIELDFMGLKGIYLLPHFGVANYLEMLLNPMQEFENMVVNPLQAAFGLGFGPLPSSIIESITGEGYFDRTYTVDQLRDLGWSMEEIADYYKKSADQRKADKTKPFGWMATYSSALFPLLGTFQRMFTIENKNILRNTAWYQSPRVRELMKFFGVNIVTLKENSLDEIAYVWNALNNLPPSLVNVYKKRLEQENPDLYKYFSDYAAMAWMNKINAMTDQELKFKEGITKIEAATVRKYYDLESEEPGSGDAWLANTPVAKDVLNRYWATKGDKETHEAGLRKFESGKMKSLVGEILNTLGTVDAEKLRKLDAMGIKHPFTTTLDKQKLYEDLYDKNGDLRIRSAEDLVAILEKHGVIKELADLMGKQAQLSDKHDEYMKLSVKAKEEKRYDDAKYYHTRSILAGVIPSDIDKMSDEEAQKYWDKWRNMKALLIDSNPAYKKRYEEDTPLWQRQYLERNAEYIARWAEILKDDGESKDGFFKKFNAQPDWFKKTYFAKYPDKALYYPVVEKYAEAVGKLIAEREKTGNWDQQAYADALNEVWKNQAALKVWDKYKPGTYNYIDKSRQIATSMAGEDTKDYFDLFYQKPGDKGWDDYREFYFSKPENEYKRVTYPFTRTWVNLIAKDKENDTAFASEWFWSPNNANARKLYGENNPIDATHSKLDYQAQWRDYSAKISKDPGQIYNLVLGSEPWFKTYYFKQHPDRAIYYPLASKIQAVDDFAKGLDMFFAPENKEARDAWEREKPGTIKYNQFWKDYGDIGDKSGQGAALDFYFDPKNAESIAKHEANNPGANKVFSLWRDFAKMPADTWEGRKARREFLRSNPSLKAWWNKGKEITQAEKEIAFKEEIYYSILDKVQAEGKGRQYYLDYFEAKAKAKKYLDDNPDLKAAREKRFADLEPVDKAIQKLLDQYNLLTLQADKNEFLKNNKELDTYFFNTVPPGIRKIWLLQRSYFNITDPVEAKQREKRRAFLELYPELVEYWDASGRPSSYYTGDKKFDDAQAILNKADDFFDAAKKHDWELLAKLVTKLPENPPDIRTEEGRWLYNKLYNNAMATWAATFGTFMSTYYFRQLPSWIRNEYFKRHPESKILSYTPIGRGLINAVTIEDSTHPDLTWARRMLRKYGSNLPSSIDAQVQKIMVKWGEWEDRSTWSSAKWSQWWEARSARLNGLRAKDLDEIPLLRRELARAQKMFSYSMLPIRNKRIHGIINPFLGAPVMLPELTIGLENDIISNNSV
jgi:hypothetical protein